MGAGARLTRLIAATIPTYNPYRSKVSAVLTGSSTTVAYSLPSPGALASRWPPARVHLLLDKVGSPDLLAYSDLKFYQWYQPDRASRFRYKETTTEKEKEKEIPSPKEP